MTPRHVAIIMDGNRRWARERGMPIVVGYRRGVTALRRTVREAARSGIEVVSAYAFSEENWGRPRAEVNLLMGLCAEAACNELLALVHEDVRVRLCGRTDRLPAGARDALLALVEKTAANSAITLNLAIDYGSRREISDAVRALVREVDSGVRCVDSIDDTAVAEHLYTGDLPDPELIIRTGGELRLSNFLLFQAAYAEYWATPLYWPDFREAQLQAALADFTSRQRRFGT